MACSSAEGAEPQPGEQCSTVPPAPLATASADDERRTIELDSEAGFVEVPANRGCLTYASRLFYSFRPADEAPATKPLLVLFNGGPGFPTSLGLLPWGTGPRSLVIPEGGEPEDAEWQDNPWSYTRFANLLYIDEANAGFSYGVGEAPSDPCPDGKFPTADAETFVRVILKFLEAHAALESNQVVIVGKSYGGYRALHILDLLLHHEELRAEHPELSEEIAQHFRRLEPEQEGPFGPIDVARQFGNLAMIQGAFYPASFSCEPAPEGVDPYRIDKPAEWDDSLILRTLNLWREEVDSTSLLGVPLDSVVGLTGPERGPAFRLPPTENGNIGQSIVADALAEKFGELPQGDSYFGAFPRNKGSNSVDAREPVVTVVPYVRIFATNALLDRTVCLDPFLQRFRLLLDNAPRPGQARPGRVVLESGSTCFEMRVPTYEHSGHDVPADQPRELAEDLEQWLHGN